jgi:hypothetical protein
MEGIHERLASPTTLIYLETHATRHAAGPGHLGFPSGVPFWTVLQFHRCYGRRLSSELLTWFA